MYRRLVRLKVKGVEVVISEVVAVVGSDGEEVVVFSF
jgi:hypothetical protein